MSNKNRDVRKPAQKRRMNEALLFIIIIAVILGGMLIYVNYKERQPSPIAGIPMPAYTLAMNAIDAIDSEILLVDAKERTNETNVTEDNENYLALQDFVAYTNTVYASEEELKKKSDNEQVLLELVLNLLSIQQNEDTLRRLAWDAEEYPAEVAALNLGDFDQIPDMLVIYESMWKDGVAAAKTNDISKMKSYLEEDVTAYSEQLEPYTEFLNNIVSYVNSIDETTGDNTSSDILSNLSGEELEDYLSSKEQ